MERFPFVTYLFLTIAGLTFSGARVVAGANTPAPESFEGDLAITAGRNLDPETPLTAFTFEPLLVWHLDAIQRLEFYAQINRPTDPHENFDAPKIIAGYVQRLPNWGSYEPSFRASLTAMEVDRWSTDGVMIRPSVSMGVIKPITSGLKFVGRIGPFAQLNEFNQRTSGANLPSFGLAERLGLVATIGFLELEARVSFEQQYTGVWKNVFGSMESATLQLDDNFKLGVAHELLGSLIDESTGSYSGFNVFDSRQSRLSLFADFVF